MKEMATLIEPHSTSSVSAVTLSSVSNWLRGSTSPKGSSIKRVRFTGIYTAQSSRKAVRISTKWAIGKITFFFTISVLNFLVPSDKIT